MTHIAECANTAETVKVYNDCLLTFDKLTEIDYTQTIEHESLGFLHVNPITKEFFLKQGETVSSVPLPDELVDRIYESMDTGADFMPLVKLWIRWLRNPLLKTKDYKDFSERFFDFVNMKYVHPVKKKELMEEHGLTDEVATERATMYQIKITAEGLLNGYKVSREVMHKYDAETGEEKPRYTRTFNVDTGEIDSEGLPEFIEDRLFEPSIMGNRGDAFYCEGANGFATPQHFIKVGCTHRLESMEQVDTNDTRSCVPGLHVGGLYYIAWYGGEIHNVFVDPMHIGAIPDSSDGAIRCMQYFVHSSLTGVNGSMYHSSTYANETDEEWEKMRAEAIEESNTTVHGSADVML
tara:strand:- start:1933 stop:2985 length:1053 start_codon:yes stop_codon:yes gene_type:complete